MSDTDVTPRTSTDPGGGRTSSEQWRRALILAIAAVVAVTAGLVAPSAWPRGPGEVRVIAGGETIAHAEVDVGDGREVRLEGTRDTRRVIVVLPAGVSPTTTTRATVRVEEEGRPLRPALDAVRLEVELADGRAELLPVLGWDVDAAVLRAARRPPVDAAVVLGLLGLVVVLWVTEVFPLFVTALLVPVILVFTGVGPAKAALAPFFDPIIALFFGGFLMAEALRRTRIDHLAAVSLVTWAGRSPVLLFAAILAVSAFLSMWMSNTASTAVLLPIVLAVTKPLGSRAYTKMAVLGLAYAATIGGVGSPVGTPANPIAIKFLDDFAGRSISFAEWFAFGLPMVVCFVPVMGVYLWWRMGVDVDRSTFQSVRWVALREFARVRRPTSSQWTVLLVFGAVMATWLTQSWHHLNTGIVALAGAAALFLLGKLQPEDLSKISWAALLTFGGGLALGVFLVNSGTSDWMATRLEGLAGWPPWVGVTAVAILALALTAVASNTATAAMLIPLAIPLAGVLGVDPVLLVVVVAIASSIDFAIPIGTPPTMIAYSTRLFSAREIFRLGIVLDFVGILLLVTAVVFAWRLLGVL